MMNDSLKPLLHIFRPKAHRHFFFAANNDATSEGRTDFLPFQVFYDLLRH